MSGTRDDNINYTTLQQLDILPDDRKREIIRAYLQYLDKGTVTGKHFNQRSVNEYNDQINEGDINDTYTGFRERYEGYGFRGGKLQDNYSKFKNMFNPKITYLATSGIDHLMMLSFSV